MIILAIFACLSNSMEDTGELCEDNQGYHDLGEIWVCDDYNNFCSCASGGEILMTPVN